MKIFLASLMIIIAGCSSNKIAKVAPDEYLKLNLVHSPKHKVCLAQREKLLKKAVTETSDAELDDELYFFVSTEKNALSFINGFDITKFTLKENQQEYEAMINGCVVKIDPKHQTCDTLNESYKYFRGLIYGLRQYPWNKTTKKLALNQAISYMNYVAAAQSSLIDILYVNDLLMRLSSLGYVQKEVYEQTVEFRKEGDKIHRELKRKVKKMAKKSLDCEDTQEFYAEERKNVIELSQKFLVMLGKVK